MVFNTLSSKTRIYILTFIALCLLLVFVPNANNPALTSISSLATTLTSPLTHPTQPRWLLITSAASSDFQRRLLVRWTWVSLFRHSNIFEHVFAVSSTDPVLLPLLKAENDTFGDILLLDNIPDTAWTANHIKPFEFFKNVTDEGWKGRTYDFVSKVDQDSFVDPVRTWEKYLKGRNVRNDGWRGRQKEDRLMLSMPHEKFCECPSPQGGFYTLSWDLAKVISRLYKDSELSKEEIGVPDKEVGQEDCMIGKFPTNAGEEYEFMSMDMEESFDVLGEKGKAIARDWSKAQVERGRLEELEGKVAFLHQMKEEWKWLAVKELFDERGWVGNRKGKGGEKLTST